MEMLTNNDKSKDNHEAEFTDAYLQSEEHCGSTATALLRLRLSPRPSPWYLTLISNPLLLALLLFLGSCSPANGPMTERITATPSVVPTPTPTSYVEPPTPIPPPLGLPPRDCHPEPTPRPIFSDVGPGYGSFPVWAFGLDSIVRIPTSYFTYTQYGWTWKIIWRVSTRYTQPITLHGGNLRTGTPLWFQIGIGDQEPGTAPTLDSHQSPREAGMGGVGLAEWGSYVFIPAAGCYYVEADWQGGSWRVTFAAGRE